MLLIIPVRNDARNLEACLRRVAAGTVVPTRLVVVDDGSTDGSGEVARGLGATVIRHEVSRGAAAARNAAAKGATEELLWFVDADVLVGPTTLAELLAVLAAAPETAAAFACYDDEPQAPGLVSPFRNLLVHHMHATASPEATIFFTGCGMMRRAVFTALGGFTEGHPLEDVELGMRALAAGHEIRNASGIRVKHAKAYGFASVVRTDVFVRGIPWTRMILAHARMADDMHLARAQRVAGVLVALAVLQALMLVLRTPVFGVWLVALAVVLGVAERRLREGEAAPLGRLAQALAALALLPLWSAPGPTLRLVLLLGAVAWINRAFLGLLKAKRGVPFAALAFFLLILYYLCALVAFASGFAEHHLERRRTEPT